MRAQKAIERNMPRTLLWLYYQFCSEYKTRPVDLEDMLDGLSCIRAKRQIEEIYADGDK